MEAEKTSLGTFSILAVELREAIWSYALTDTTIVYHAVTETVPIPLLLCSKTICEEVISTILRERSVTFQTHAALSTLLGNCKSEQTTSATKDGITTAPRYAKLPKKIRLSLFCTFRGGQKGIKALTTLDLDPRRAEAEQFAEELAGWWDVLQHYPIAHLTTLILDCNSSPRYHGGPGYAPPCMTTFMKRVTTRIHMVSKGKCRCLVAIPPEISRELMWHAGAALFWKEWTPEDDGWSAKKIQEALNSSRLGRMDVTDPSSSPRRSRKRRRTNNH
jgi:hypothetical protein